MAVHLRNALIVGAGSVGAHWAGHSYFGDASTFEAAGVNGAGLVVFVVSAGLVYWLSNK